ncbi:MAG: ABC transporter ATP-binding protein [Desulfamplus sp.]|nr:ABC transporter ATP-binding protein [Desulfamplus sp.]MBF0241203.1 ABC transporter ATP-binding protein [Desulfamplus sp.]MBF0389933.1 ABC transporter ATP-binding protein [Desulfamplus sp.]
MRQNIIEIKDISHIYSTTGRGLKNISFSVESGEFIIVAGKNGSGKSTLFRHLNGLLSPTSGKILIHGKDVSSNIRYARQVVGMIFQDADCQIVGQTVFEDAAFGPENLGLSFEEVNKRTTKALAELGLIHLKDQNPATLSGGEKRRLAIAGVLTMRPDVVVLDEPFANLDYAGTSELLSAILWLNKAGHTIILSTHDIEKCIFWASRMLIIHEGRLVADDKPQYLLKDVEKFGIREPCASKLGMNIMAWR